MEKCIHRVATEAGLEAELEDVRRPVDSTPPKVDPQPTPSNGFCRILTLYNNDCHPEECQQSEKNEETCPAIEFYRH